MENPFNFFDKIFYINLEKRIDRKESIEKQFNKFGIIAERFNAVNLTKEENDELIHRGCVFYDDTRPEYAPRIKSCTLSHLHILFRSKMMNYNNVLIFEDDVIIDDNIINELSCCLDELKTKEWNMFYLGCNPLEYYKETDHLGRVVRTTTTHAYAINKNFYDKILTNADFFKPYPCIDGYYGGLGAHQNNKIYMSLKNLVYQKNDYSDIECTNVDYTASINDKYKHNIIENPTHDNNI